MISIEGSYGTFFLTAIAMLTILASCGQPEKRTAIETSEQKNAISLTTIKPKPVDYKSHIYKIALGENYKKSGLVIDWSWASEADIDGKIDATGKDAFLFLSEPHIKYNDEEWLPSLHIETDKNIITSFTSSVLFNLADTVDAETTFLRILSKDITQLQNNDIIQTLIEKGIYETITPEVTEVFKLTTGKEGEYDTFEYTIKLN